MSTVAVHAAHDPACTNPGQTHRNPVTGRALCFTPPSACTTSRVVDQEIVNPLLEIRAAADFIDGHVAAVQPRILDLSVLDELARAQHAVATIRAQSERAAGCSAGCADRLRVAEQRKNYDALADLRIYDGREIAGFLKPPLNVIGRLDLTYLRDAREALIPWFQEFGEDLFAKRVELYTRHRRILRAELDRWQRS